MHEVPIRRSVGLTQTESCDVIYWYRLDDRSLEERDKEHTCDPHEQSSNVRVRT